MSSTPPNLPSSSSSAEPQKTTAELDAEIKKEAERVFRHLAIDFITRHDPEFDISQSYNYKCPDLDPLSLVHGIGDNTAPSFPTRLQPIFCPDTGRILDYEERWECDEDRAQQSRNSMSIRRAPDPRAFNRLMGNSSNVPFLPAGFDDEVEVMLRFSDSQDQQQQSSSAAEEEPYLNFEVLLDTPPGFAGPVDLSSFQLKFPETPVDDDVEGEELEAGQDEKQEKKITMEELGPILEEEATTATALTTSSTSTAKDRPLIASRQEKQQNITNGPEEAFSLPEEETQQLEQVVSSASDAAISSTTTAKPKKRADSEFAYAQVLDVSRRVAKYDDIKDTMAQKYPFELDPFQQQAVVCMEQGDSVFVAAHTSAGKTVVAEYAVALCKLHRTRVIYTSPIKALSNQKFRDFRLHFGDVGLVTGDIQLHSDAFCLIMTTEILRSMLYNGSEVIRELEWCIFDEVHYINDEERGHVWEEVLIMLPAHVKIVMLSATVPNCMEFADWVGRIKNRKIFVIQTLKRPVPLEHYLYTGQDGKTKNDRFLLMDKHGSFLTSGYQKAVEAKARKMEKLAEKAGRGGGAAGSTRGGAAGARGGAAASARGGARASLSNQRWQINKNSKNVYINLIDHLRTQDLLPMVVFVFSRQRCDENAQLLNSVDLTTAEQKSAIHRFFTRCIDRLKGTDKQLPQVLLMQELCKRGFAVHHSGILPIVKEVVELLFQRGLVKILFATETFAMGVNMPARTVVFDTTEKFDGTQRRALNATEYVQMAGRAGRRGLDSTGTVIILAKGPEPPDIVSLKTMLMGKPIRLESRFRITYGMLLNLLRVEQLRIEDMLQRSYVERASLRMVVSRKEQLRKIDEQIESLPPVECEQCSTSLEQYFSTLLAYFDALATTWSMVVQKSREDKLFAPGRVLVIHYAPLGIVGRLAVVLKSRFNDTGTNFLLTLFVPIDANDPTDMEQRKKFEELDVEAQRWKRLDLLLGHVVRHGPESISPVQTLSRDAPFTVLEDVGLDSLMAVCRRTVGKIDVEAVMEEHRRIQGPYRAQSPDRAVRKLLNELDTLTDRFIPIQRQKRDLSELVYVLGQDLERREVDLLDRLRTVKELRARLVDPEASETSFPCAACPQIGQHISDLLRRAQLTDERTRLVFQTSSDSLQFSKEYTDRLRVLQALNYIDRYNMVGLKGKVACEISNQELLITELILENRFDRRTPAEIAAMLSSLTCQFDAKSSNNHNSNREQYPQQNSSSEKPERVPKELLKELEHEVMQVACRIDSVQKACGVVSSPVVEELKFGLVEVVHQWATGMEFADIMRLSEAQEGIIVRCIQRLDEVCKDVRKAARIVGDPALFEKMEETSAAIRRDIVFAASLYTTEE